MELIKRSKCAGCAALRTSRKRNSKGKFLCALKFKINQKKEGAIYYQPEPADPCLKPSDDSELRKAKRELKKKDGSKT